MLHLSRTYYLTYATSNKEISVKTFVMIDVGGNNLTYINVLIFVAGPNLDIIHKSLPIPIKDELKFKILL